MEDNTLSRNSLAFIALANEFCHDMEHSEEKERIEFVDSMLKILPRIYMAATDIDIKEDEEDEHYLDSFLDEENYEIIKDRIAQIMGEDDVYLEVFLEGMQYSDTPIATTISENLSDIYQDFYNFIAAIQDVPNEIINESLAAIKTSFINYWGQILVNVLRALHNQKYNDSIE